MKNKNPRGLFDEEIHLEILSKKKDPLMKLNDNVEWEIFRSTIEKIFIKEPQGPGGRPPYDYIMMFKVLILQRLYNISDEQTEYQIYDRLSFMRFLGLGLGDKVPDQNTIWLFREKLIRFGLEKDLFKRFDKQMEKEGLCVKEGSIVDATIVEVPKQRNSKEENKQIKQGKVPEDWKDNPEKLRQKDTDARWLTKGGINYFGYKNHIKICLKSKLITNYAVSDASVHDSQAIETLLEPKDSHHEIYGDSAYSGEGISILLKKKKIRNRIHKKGYRDNPLKELEIENNRNKSRVRARVEHVFGFLTNSMKGIFLRSVGKRRAKGVIGLMNLTYNMCRYVQLAN